MHRCRLQIPLGWKRYVAAAIEVEGILNLFQPEDTAIVTEHSQGTFGLQNLQERLLEVPLRRHHTKISRIFRLCPMHDAIDVMRRISPQGQVRIQRVSYLEITG